MLRSSAQTSLEKPWRLGGGFLLGSLVALAGCPAPPQTTSQDTQPASFEIEAGCVHELAEIGDEFSSYEELGILALPTVICGSIYETGHAPNNAGDEVYSADADTFRFEVPEDASYRLSLDWEPEGGDFDLLLYDTGGATIDFSYEDKPETFNSTVVAGESYLVVVGGWEGDPGAWALEISQNQ